MAMVAIPVFKDCSSKLAAYTGRHMGDHLPGTRIRCAQSTGESPHLRGTRPPKVWASRALVQ